MKIVHLVPNFYPASGGVETYVYELSKRLVGRGHDVTVVTSNILRFTNRKLKEFELINGIKVYRVPFKLIIRNVVSLSATRLLLDLDYDVLHIHTMGYFLDIAPFLKVIKNCKIVLSTHGGIFHTSKMKLLKNVYFHNVAKLSLKFADYIIAHSKNDEELFSKISDRKKIKLVPYGIDWKKLSRMEPKGKKELIYVGRLSKNKRLDRIVSLLPYIRREIKDIKLAIVGEDWKQKKSLLAMAKKLGVHGNIKFSGAVPHDSIQNFLIKSNVFLLSSDYEGFGISVIEAMAVGLPVVVNNIESMRLIIKNGKNGYIVNFDDYDTTAKIIISLLKNKKLASRIGNNAKSYSKRYDWDNVIGNVEKLYKN